MAYPQQQFKERLGVYMAENFTFSLYYDKLYKKEFTLKQYKRRILGLANPHETLQKELLNQLFNDSNNNLKTPNNHPP